MFLCPVSRGDKRDSEEHIPKDLVFESLVQIPVGSAVIRLKNSFVKSLEANQKVGKFTNLPANREDYKFVFKIESWEVKGTVVGKTQKTALSKDHLRNLGGKFSGYLDVKAGSVQVKIPKKGRVDKKGIVHWTNKFKVSSIISALDGK